MLRVAVTAGIELRVVQMLARPTSLATTAERTGLTYRQVNEIAIRHGYPDVRRLEQAVPALQEAAKTELADHLRDGGTTELHPIDGEAPALLPKEPRPTVAITDRELVRVPVAGIFPDPENLRDDVGDVTELAASIRETGLLQPIVARRRGEILIVVAGHRRLAALQLLDENETDVIVVRDMRPDDVVAAMLIENGHRADLSPLEEARGLAKLKKSQSLSSTELGARIGRSQSWVDGRLALLALGSEQQDMVRAGQMGIGQAQQAARARMGTSRAHATYRFHLGAEHPLASRVRARCLQIHGPRGARIVGHTGCGECWETVIRADEHRTSLERALDGGGPCPTCEQPVDPDVLAALDVQVPQ